MFFDSSIPLKHISIHALREESDLNELFDGDTTYVISIHALREESDCLWLTKGERGSNFNPRSP